VTAARPVRPLAATAPAAALPARQHHRQWRPESESSGRPSTNGRCPIELPSCQGPTRSASVICAPATYCAVRSVPAKPTIVHTDHATQCRRAPSRSFHRRWSATSSRCVNARRRREPGRTSMEANARRARELQRGICRRPPLGQAAVFAPRSALRIFRLIRREIVVRDPPSSPVAAQTRPVEARAGLRFSLIRLWSAIDPERLRRRSGAPNGAGPASAVRSGPAA